MEEKRSYKTLSELQDLIGESLKREFGDAVWVVAEISDIKVNYSGHCYMELVEKEAESEEISARIRGIIWSRQARMLLPYFETTTGSSLGEGMKILVAANLEYHKLYGISIVITDIDPAYTLGEMAVKRAAILRRLEQEGVIEMNRGLPFPLFPERIAVISSTSAAGYGDFISHLRNNKYGYNFKPVLFPAVMQGKETSASVTAALSAIHEDIDNFDIVVIVRGGGSQSDLSWFDDYDIAFLITQFRIPVLTGIGHERDTSVADIVSFTSLKTPTAVADYIISQTTETESYLDSTGRQISEQVLRTIEKVDREIEKMADRLKKSSSELIQRKRASIGLKGVKIPSGARMKLQIYAGIIDHINRRVPVASKRLVEENEKRTGNLALRNKELALFFLSKKNDEIAVIERSVSHLSPDAVLARGYSLTLLNGVTVKDASDVKRGDRITTIVRRGSFDSEVFDI